MGVCLLAMVFGAVADDASADTLLSSRFMQREAALLKDNTKGPVARVVKMLEDMSKQMQEDADSDEDVNEEMLCWCKSNENALTKAIKDNTEKADSLRTNVESLRAKSQSLNTELDTLKKETDENEKALDQSVAMRKKELKEFTSAESATMQSINQLNGAASAIKAGMSSSMMQSEISLDSSSDVGRALKKSVFGHHDIVWALHSEKERNIVLDLMSHERDIGFIQAGFGSGRALSAPHDLVYGTISSLGDAFKDNLKKLQQDENDAQAAHEAQKHAKKEEIEAALGMINAKTATLADTDERAAQQRQELDDTEDALNADNEFLPKVREQCALHAKDFEERKNTRALEMAAVSKATAFLASDEAKDMFTKSLGHTKRPEGGKLGSRSLKEYKEERHTESKRSQTNSQRRKQWGTDDRYMLLQLQNTHFQEAQPTSSHSSISAAVPAKDVSTPEAKKLAALAARTEAYWSSKYYMQSNGGHVAKQNQTAGRRAAGDAKSSRALRASASSATESPKRNKLGLTAEQMKVRGNEMSDVGAGVRKMREALQLQQGEEAARRDWCQEEIHTSEKQLDNLKRDQYDHEEKIELMAERMKQLKLEIKNMNHDQEDADIETQKASNDRRKACTSFQRTVMNQINTKKLLGMALEVLEGFYGKKNKEASLIREKVSVGASFSNAVQQVRQLADTLYPTEQALSFQAAKNEELRTSNLHQSALLQGQAKKPSARVQAILDAAKKQGDDGQALIRAGEAAASGEGPKAMLQGGDDPDHVRAPPPPGFGGYTKSRKSGGVTALITMLMDDTQAMIDEAVKGETESMTGYETYVKEANEATELRQQGILDRRTDLGKLEQFTEEEKISLKETLAHHAQVRQYNIDLYGVEGCQFLLANYEVRYINRKEEIDSLKEAEAVLGAGGGDPNMAAATGKNDPHAGDHTQIEVTDDGMKMKAEVTGDGIPEDEKAVIHMAGGTQKIDTTF